MRLRPVRDYVLVKPVEPQSVTSPIVRADAFVPMLVNGVILEVGPGRTTRKGHPVPMETSVGQVVYFGPNPQDAQEVVIGREKLLLMPERCLMGIVSAAL